MKHPQDTPLSEWSDGWLTLSVCHHTDARYMIMTDAEKASQGWPVARDEKIALLIAKGDVPKAGTGL